MGKTRLNKSIRLHLFSLVDEIVKPKKELDTLERDYNRIAALIRVMFEKSYPKKQMDTLTKYDCSSIKYRVKVQLSSGAVDQFFFLDGEGVTVPDVFSHTGKVHSLNQLQTHKFKRWIESREDYDEEKKKRVSAYKTLIRTSTYLEDVVDVWPEAIEAKPKPQALVPVNNETVACIQADMNERRKT